jgi:hypothetical protein
MSKDQGDKEQALIDDISDVFDAIEGAKEEVTEEVESKSFERGHNKRVREMNDVSREHEAIASLMQPFEAQLNAAGMDRVAGIRSLVGAQQMLTQNPAHGIEQLISQYGGAQAKDIVSGIAKKMGLLDAAIGEADDYVDPAVSALNGRFDKIEQQIQQTQTNTEQQRINEANNQIKAFAEAKDEQGNLLHPHFKKVEAAMGSALQSGAATGMEAAYSQATWADAELREELIKERMEKSNQKAGAVRKKTVSQAKKASRNVNSRKVAKRPEAPDRGLKDEVEAAYDAVANR